MESESDDAQKAKRTKGKGKGKGANEAPEDDDEAYQAPEVGVRRFRLWDPLAEEFGGDCDQQTAANCLRVVRLGRNALRELGRPLVANKLYPESASVREPLPEPRELSEAEAAVPASQPHLVGCAGGGGGGGGGGAGAPNPSPNPS